MIGIKESRIFFFILFMDKWVAMCMSKFPKVACWFATNRPNKRYLQQRQELLSCHLGDYHLETHLRLPDNIHLE
jgi:hypothetical protein